MKWLIYKITVMKFINGFIFSQKQSSKHSSWGRHLEEFLKTSFVFFFRRCLQDVLKTSWSRRIYSPYSYVFRRRLQDVLIKIDILVLAIRSWRCLHDVFKTSSKHFSKTSWRRLAKTSSRHLQDVFKTPCKNVLKTFSRHLQDVLQRCFEDFFKTYHRVKLFA